VKLTNTQKIISERVKNLSQNDCNTVFSSIFDNKFIIKYFSYFLDSDFEGSKIIETIWKNFESSKQCNRRNNHIFVNSYLILARQATTSELKLLLDESEFPPFEPLTTLFKLDDKAECYHTYVNFLQKQMELLNNSTYSCH
jgi:hypothetical protein